MKAIVSTLLLFFILVGCKESNSDCSACAYFGGEINNPTADYVTLRYSKSKFADTLFLDDNNRFIQKIENLNPGIYFFSHGGEYQMFLLEPNDSIMFRLNTADFDESLVYSGNGAKKNNWIIRSFLENEQKARKLSDYFRMEPQAFHSMIETKRVAAHERLTEYLDSNPESDQFIQLAKGQIDYGHFALKEIYPFGYFGNNKMVHIKDLPEDFYSFRSKVDFNSTELSEVYAYSRYLFSFFDNIAVNEYYKHHDFHESFDRESLLHNLSKLKLIDSVIENEQIKNNLLKFTTRNFINGCNNLDHVNIMLSDYLNRCADDDSKKEMTDLAEAISKIQPGRKLPNIELVDAMNNTHNILDLIDETTVIYFWSSNYKRHLKNVQRRVLQLKEQHPKIKFVAININTDNKSHWKKTLENAAFDLNSEYRFKDASYSRKAYVINSVNKVILVDKNHTIIHPNVRMFGNEMENLLAGL